eukprot:TRINITY_DN86872_c0_g1_i1.p1 TRINITY_DN86872_c0_g1~~TRINITY_DN86872_c0_g1_i1.p1  ORF type:complete len:357 (-),score=31.34 TRINITY_DN86872_c0_g1_i1:68-1138(-)
MIDFAPVQCGSTESTSHSDDSSTNEPVGPALNSDTTKNSDATQLRLNSLTTVESKSGTPAPIDTPPSVDSAQCLTTGLTLHSEDSSTIAHAALPTDTFDSPPGGVQHTTNSTLCTENHVASQQTFECVTDRSRQAYAVEDSLKRAVTHLMKDLRKPDSVDLMINLKDYDPAKYRRFCGRIQLPHLIRPNMKILVVTTPENSLHIQEATQLGLEYCLTDELLQLDKSKKLVKKWAKSYQVVLASEDIVTTLPRLVGPGMARAGRLPTPIPNTPGQLEKVVQATKATVKFQLKKTLNLGSAVGDWQLNEAQVGENTWLAVQFLVSLLPHQWAQVDKLLLKSTKGKPHVFYPVPSLLNR